MKRYKVYENALQEAYDLFNAVVLHTGDDVESRTLEWAMHHINDCIERQKRERKRR